MLFLFCHRRKKKCRNFIAHNEQTKKEKKRTGKYEANEEEENKRGRKHSAGQH
jgi:hypothetical protein